MANDGGGSPQDLVVQTWIMYSIAILLYLMRVYSRYVRLGLKWQLDDFLMLFALFLYTIFAVTNIAIIEGGGSSLYLPGEFATFTPQDIADRIKGSKIEFGSEMCMLNTMYVLKACMLLIFFQITSNLRQHTLVQICAGYTFLGWLATVLVLFLNCHPLSGYWQLPPPQQECATYFRYEVTQAVFNISSDVVIFSIILPMLFKVKMPWKTKLPLLFIFSMGLVVVICACTSKYFTFRDIWDTSYQFWYLREASIAMYTTNLPFIWGLARQTFRFLRPADSNQEGSYHVTRTYGGGTLAKNPRSKVGGDTRNRTYNNLESGGGRSMGEIQKSESEERIFEMKGLGSGSEMNYAKMADGSETISWAQSDGMVDETERAKELGIRKTMEVIVKKTAGDA